MTEQKYIRVEELKTRATKRLYASNHGSMAEAYCAALIDLIDTEPTYTTADILAGMWVPVSERLPEPRKKVLARHADGRIRVGWRSILGDFMDEPLYGIVTHWMPLPQPPKEDKP